MGVDPPVCSVRNLASRGYETKVERGGGRYANNMSSVLTFSYGYFRYMTKSKFRRKGMYLGLCTNHGMFRQYNSNVLSQFEPIWDSTVLRNEHAILPDYKHAHVHMWGSGCVLPDSTYDTIAI